MNHPLLIILSFDKSINEKIKKPLRKKS